MNKEKQFDCVKFKNELQKNLLKNSGAKNLQEYVDYANKLAQKSPLHKQPETAAKTAF
jgi:hypothetical protein